MIWSQAVEVFTLLPCLKKDSVAQLVEQLTLNQWVESSNLSGVTLLNTDASFGVAG
jgi:hypothetical protein